MYQPIDMTWQVRQALPGVQVIGLAAAVKRQQTPETVDWRTDWEVLHAAWKGKTKAEVASHPRIRAFSDFYAQIGLNPKQSPPSVQNLIQRFLLREALERFPQIHPLVDAVNVAALETCTPLGILDAGTMEGPIRLAVTEGGEEFLPIGAEQPVTFSAGVVVLRDKNKILSQFCYRDGEAQKITPATQNIWLLGCQVPGIDDASVLNALNRASALISREYQITPTSVGPKSGAPVS